MVFMLPQRVKVKDGDEEFMNCLLSSLCQHQNLETLHFLVGWKRWASVPQT
ncbi:hypothetical protein SLEP1_g4035 [Rubroshorea leprosula]|uniref:Uncharacterized protein n=1 Tax=Rubroshorea leprosula TaxID=152421 RepID=A0AAV5HTU5_9ROSI|nr:hypothetical protein SLEP1_g4035 [Rubroshorea leprosula]